MLVIFWSNPLNGLNSYINLIFFHKIYISSVLLVDMISFETWCLLRHTTAYTLMDVWGSNSRLQMLTPRADKIQCLFCTISNLSKHRSWMNFSSSPESTLSQYRALELRRSPEPNLQLDYSHPRPFRRRTGRGLINRSISPPCPWKPSLGKPPSLQMTCQPSTRTKLVRTPWVDHCRGYCLPRRSLS